MTARRDRVSLREHLAALREADLRFDAERDKRYAEVASEREKALKIKETADLAALELAREIQTYKDEKANELREQIHSERGLYATKGDLASVEDKVAALIKPLSDYVTAQTGQARGAGQSWRLLAAAVALAAGIGAVAANMPIWGTRAVTVANPPSNPVPVDPAPKGEQ